jgi:hypothetical protein
MRIKFGASDSILVFSADDGRDDSWNSYIEHQVLNSRWLHVS